MMLNRLRTFVEVYRQRSISGAARSLDLTQPAVSQHIAGLEAAIGRPLFERSVHGVQPTAAADELATGIGDRLDVAESALATARARSTEMAGTVRIIGLVDFLAEVVAPLLVPLLEDGVRVRLQAGYRSEVVERLIDGDGDLGFVGYEVEDRRVRCESLREESAIAVAAPAVAARLAEAADLRAALHAEPLLAYNLERPLVDMWLAQNRLAGQPIIPALVGQDMRGLRRLLEAGFGWTVLPLYLCGDALERGKLAEIPAPVGPVVMQYHLVWAAGALRQPRVAHARAALSRALKK